MSHRDLMEAIIERSKLELDEAEVFISTGKNRSLESFRGEISKYEIAESGGLSLRGKYRGNMGYAYTEKLEVDQIDYLIDQVKKNSLYIEEGERIYSGSRTYSDFKIEDYDMDELSIEEKIDKILFLEKLGRSMDKRVSEIMVYYTEYSGDRLLGNTKGLRLFDRDKAGIVSISSVVKDGEETKTGSSYKLFKDLGKLENLESLVEEAVGDSIKKLGGKTVKSGDYPIIIENDSFSSLLNSFKPIFYAENVQKGLSLFADKIGSEVGVSKFSLFDDPFIEDGFGSKAFDDEGVATRRIDIIDQGVLKAYIYNLKSASKDRVESTGHGARSYKGKVRTAFHNLCVKNGCLDLEDLYQAGDGGIYIDSLQGLHSGLDPVSGDFSLSASGYKIENARLARPVNQITIAGNFFELLFLIEDLANDFKFSQSGGGTIGSPSILIKKLSVSGD